MFENEDEAVVILCKPKSMQASKLPKSVCEGAKENEDDDDDDDQWEDDDEASDDDDDVDDDSDDDEDTNDDDEDDDFSMEDESINGKAKTALTSYSMSSSVMPRNAGLTLLDDRFEKVVICLTFKK